MSKTKATGTSGYGRRSQPKYLGIKINDNQSVKTGMVIIRQRGTKFIPGNNVRIGGDDTLYAGKPGMVKFTTKKVKRFDGSQRLAKVVSIIVEK